MERISTAVNGRRPAWRWPGWLAIVLIAAISSLALIGQGAAARDDAAPRSVRDEAAPRTAPRAAPRAVEVYRPGGMAPSHSEHAFGNHRQAATDCLLAGETERASPGAGTGAKRAELSRLFEIIGTSVTGRAVLGRARRHGVQVCIDSETALLAYYFAGRRMAGIRATLSQGGKIAFLAHELAHVPQHPAYSDNRYYPPADLILLRRVREAAAEAVAIRIAWELREGGDGAAWDAKMATAYADMAHSFATAAIAGAAAAGATDLIGPTRAAFDRWFEAPWRRDTYDRMTLAHLARISEDPLGLVPPRYALSHDFLAAIAWMEDRNFLTETGVRLLTEPVYGGRLSDGNARSLAQFNAQISLSAGPFRTVPIAAISP